MKVILIAIVLFQPLIIFGQNVFVKKVINQDRAHLVIGVENGGSTDWYFAGCSFKSVALLPDTTKIRLIGDLLDFTADTTKCDNIILNLSGRYTVIRKQPLSRQYNLQIDALILINYIALSSKAFYYSPYPLLYDKETEKEICCNSEGLDTVIAIYKNWYLELKQNGFSDYCYPLYDKRYEWFAGKFKQQKIKGYPRWDNFFDCMEIE